MSTTVITADEIELGDRLIISNAYRARFAIEVERIDADRRYVTGRLFSIGTLDRQGFIAFSGTRCKVASLRPTTTIERVEVPA